MIIVRLMGGLGNQMFQYAFGRALAYKNDTILKLDLSFFSNQSRHNKKHVFRNYALDIFNIKENFATPEEVFRLSKRSGNVFLDKSLNKILGVKKSFIIEPHYHFSSSTYNAPDNTYFAGYWQTEKYFSEITSLIRSDFTFKEEMTGKAKEVKENIKNSNSVCVHVRRGDLLTNSNHSFCGLPYYQQAEKIIRETISNPSYFVFSDEIEWCRENMQFLAGAKFISNDLAGYKDQDHLRMMAHCKNFIIPNSSFAWWAVWLNQEVDKIVVTPKVWFNDPNTDEKDLIPANWVTI